ncbi:MAG: glucose 1-dehydrogenase [Chloroflexi bacterium]|nr:glucose 1-dehydrogenase [Chloroflexota bacterium]
MTSKRFENQVVIVTGASQGIGQATAIAFAREGAFVVVNYRQNAEGARQTLAAMETVGQGGGVLVQADVGALEGCLALMEAADALGPVSVLVNNAAFIARSSFLDAPVEELTRSFEVNVRGPYYLSQMAARRMIRQGRGAIIHISSILARQAMPNRSAYIASKGAIEALTRAMALDLAPYNIRVNAIAPGLVDTKALRAGFPHPEFERVLASYILANRLGRPEELARAILFLASDEASYINGIVLPVDAGLAITEAGPAIHGDS